MFQVVPDLVTTRDGHEPRLAAGQKLSEAVVAFVVESATGVLGHQRSHDLFRHESIRPQPVGIGDASPEHSDGVAGQRDETRMIGIVDVDLEKLVGHGAPFRLGRPARLRYRCPAARDGCRPSRRPSAHVFRPVASSLLAADRTTPSTPALTDAYARGRDKGRREGGQLPGWATRFHSAFPLRSHPRGTWTFAGRPQRRPLPFQPRRLLPSPKGGCSPLRGQVRGRGG